MNEFTTTGFGPLFSSTCTAMTSPCQEESEKMGLYHAFLLQKYEVGSEPVFEKKIVAKDEEQARDTVIRQLDEEDYANLLEENYYLEIQQITEWDI